MHDQAGRITGNHLLLIFGIVLLTVGAGPLLKLLHATGALPSYTAADVAATMDRQLPGRSFRCHYATGGGWNFVCFGTETTAEGESIQVKYAVKSGWRNPVVTSKLLEDAQPRPLARSVPPSRPAPPSKPAPPSRPTPSYKRPVASQRAPQPPPHPDARLNLNRAGEAQLRAVPGMDPDVARRIVLMRKHRLFTTVDDLWRVEGVDRAMLEGIRPYVFAGTR
jgi:hypothetical protein